ncbi:hypothetical protein LJB99_05935 [Deltaproteobacteria bacterium OttesenSCG-928-K17]|nr:hypothetical protein [Deltaproteobacteria bacterium OttesenSCG-928-K17]
MSKIIAALSMVVILGAAALYAEEAAKPAFPPFVITIPNGFTTSYNPGNGKTGQSLTIAPKDRSAVYTVSIEALAPGQWESMLDQMLNKPKANTGPAEVQGKDQFLVTYNDTASGLAGRQIFQRINDGAYLKQVSLGYHPELNAAASSLSLQFEAEENQ